MKKIILATASPARRGLFKYFGLKFICAKTNAFEDHSLKHFGNDCARLAISNAAKKARLAALNYKAGLVVSADTVVLQGKEIFGKPKSINDAKKMLRKLSRAPHWVYTGICVLDIKTKTEFTDFEKTKVFMKHISDVEITNYFKTTNPLAHAGSFDIQGKGALFIERIEGCFYNVVGLPVSKLYNLLKKSGILIAFFIFLVSFAGCATEYNIATKDEEIIYYSTDKEIAIGRSVAQQIEKEGKVSKDFLLKKRVQDIGEKIAAVSERKDINYVFGVLDDEEINAVSLPGGFIYINRGLLEKATDDELACVIAHEVGHITAKHAIKRLQSNTAYSLLRILAGVGAQSSEAVSGIDSAYITLLMGYSRKDELLADTLAARYAKAAGYDPRAMISFLNKLDQIDKKKPPREYSYWRTHPHTPDRVRTVKEEIGESISFGDYINKEDVK
jgi:MAF protein